MEARFKRNFICKVRGWLVPVSPLAPTARGTMKKKKKPDRLTPPPPPPRAKAGVDRGRGGGTLLVGSGVVPNKVAVNQFLF